MYATARVIGHRYLLIDEKVQEEQGAADLYRHLCAQASWGRLWSAVTRRTARLLPLAAVEGACTAVGCCDAETRTVPIDRIRGSANRCSDFDAEFRPLHSHDRARWIRLAAARLRGAKLPPVELIEVAGVYFVVDGHHRISVARALGEVAIRARVTIWQVAGPLPWQGMNCRGRSR
jgi:hypothetical protein